MISETIQTLSLLGRGSLVTLLAQNWLSRNEKIKERTYEEKKVAFVGLLAAIRDTSIERNAETLAKLGYWRMRCDLVASDAVRVAIANRIDRTSSSDDSHEALAEALRSYLGLEK